MRENSRGFLIATLAILASVCWFYWSEYRPSKIKHECSWIKKHKDAIPERPAQTIYDVSDAKLQELEGNGVIKHCPQWDEVGKGFLQEWQDRQPCRDKNDQIIQNLKIMMPAEPAKDWWIKAKKEEYQFCLHHNGL